MLDGLHAQRRHQLLGDLRVVRPASRNFAEAHARLQRERDVLAHRQVGDDAAVFAVFGTEPEPQAQRIRRVIQLCGFAVDADVTRVARVEREQQPRELGAARA